MTTQVEIDRLRRAVAANTNLVDSLIAQRNGLVQAMRDSADDADEIRALADQLEADARKDAAAVVESTPVADTPAAEDSSGVPVTEEPK